MLIRGGHMVDLRVGLSSSPALGLVWRLASDDDPKIASLRPPLRTVRATSLPAAEFQTITLLARMSHGWKPNDKAIAKAAAERARRRAEQEAIRLHADYKVKTIEDLWALELKIREWRKGRQHCFTLNYERASEQLADWLARGWLHESDLERMSPERLHAIKVKA